MKVVYTGHPFVSLEWAQKIYDENGIEVEFLQTKDPEEMVKAVKNADVIITGMERFDKKVIDSLKQCKMITRLGVGYDTIDVAAATARGIMVANVADFCVDEVSDHAIAMLLAVARKLIPGQQAAKGGSWGPRAIEGRTTHRVKGQTLGLFGFGRIARMTAEKAKGFKMTVIAFDPYVSKEDMAKEGVEKVEMKELLSRSDYLSLHTPLTKDTQNAFGLQEFKQMKQTAWLINTARGPVIREEDLIAALEQKLIAGAALDVLVKEPPDATNPLFKMDNVIITPHIAAVSWEGLQVDLQVKSAEDAVRAVKGERPLNLVNPEVLAR